ncbi:MAG: hypothetical protein R3E39_24305 [Anaerolineae bacterium]
MTTKEMPRIEMIVAARQQYVQERRSLTPIEAVRALASLQRRPQPILTTINQAIGEQTAVTLIGKMASHMGDLTTASDEARRLAETGIDAVMVQTDMDIESPGLNWLVTVTNAVSIPIISRDIIVDEYQVVEARAAGASSLVLYASVLEPTLLRSLVSATQRNRMTAIVDVNNRTQIEQANTINPYVIALSQTDPLTGEQVDTSLRDMRTLIPSHIRVMLSDTLHSLEAVETAVNLEVDAVIVDSNLLSDSYCLREIHTLLRR